MTESRCSRRSARRPPRSCTSCRRRSCARSARGVRSTRSRAAKTSTSRSRRGSTTSTSSTTSACSCSTSARARRHASMIGRGSGPATAAVSSRSGWATARCRASTRCDPERFARNRETARSVAGWMDRYFTVRDREDRRNRRFFAKNGPVRTNLFGWAHAGWRRVRPRLPARIANRLGEAARRVE